MLGLDEEVCTEPVIVVGALHPRQLMPAGGLCLRKAVTSGLWGVTPFCKQRLYIHRTSPTLLFHFLKVFQNKFSLLFLVALGLDIHLFLVIL